MDDVCGVCGGTAKSSLDCGNTKTIVTGAVAAAGGVIGATIAAIAAAVAGFFLYKRWRNGANWYIPNSLLDESNEGVQVNEMYDPDKENQMQENPGYEGSNNS